MIEFTCPQCGAFNKVAGYCELADTGMSGTAIRQVRCWKCAAVLEKAPEPKEEGK